MSDAMPKSPIARAFRRAFALFFAIAMAGLLATCDLFSVGLGSKVDVTAPRVNVASPSQGAYLRGTAVISGAVSDDVAVTSMEVQIANQSGTILLRAPAVVSGSSYSATIDTTLLPDARLVLTAVASDGAGKESSFPLSINVDNHAPVVMVSAPLSYGGANSPRLSDYLDVKGEAYDSSPIASVRVRILDSGGLEKASKLAQGTATWAVRFDLKDPDAEVSLVDGTQYDYDVVVTDLAGNASSHYYHRGDLYEHLLQVTDFPTMDEIGQVEISGGDARGLSAAELAGERLASGVLLADFVYDADARPEILFTNLDKLANASSNLLGLSAPITGLVIPPPNAGSIVPSSLVADIYREPDTVTPVLSLSTVLTPDLVTITSLGDGISFVLELEEGGPPLAEGVYLLRIHAATQSGIDSGIVEAAFSIDAQAPILTETGMGIGNLYTGAAFTLSGEADSGSGLDRVDIYLAKDNDPFPALPDDSVSLSGTHDTWTWTSAAPPTLVDGAWSIKATLVTDSLKTVDLFRSITVDTTEPEAAFNAIVPSIDIAGTTTVNGTARISAYAVDANGLSGVRRWTLSAGDPAPSWNTAGFADWSLPLSVDIDTVATLSDDTDYRTWLLVRDRAGNETLEYVEYRVDQDADLPSLALENLDASVNAAGGVSAVTNLLGLNPSIRGAISDDDLVDAASLRLSLDSTNGIDGTWFAPSTLGSNGKTVSFVHDLNAIGEGVKKVHIKVSDLAAAKMGRPAAERVFGPIYFGIDKADPALAVSAPSTGGSLQRADFSISGTASDANGLLGGKVSIRNGATLVAEPSVIGNAWSVTVDVGSLGEGPQTWTVTAQDSFGKSSPALSVPFTVDTLAPSLAVAIPAVSSWTKDASLLASGTTSDPNGVASISWSLDSTDGEDGTWTSASLAAPAWSANLNLGAYPEGAQVLWLRSTDSAGNVAAASRAFGADRSAPSSDIEAVDADSDAVFALSSASSAAASAKALFAFSGGASDPAGGSGLASVRIVEKKGSDPAVEVYSLAAPAFTGAWASPDLPSGGLADGNYLYTITIGDQAGNETSYTRSVLIDTTPPEFLAIASPSAGRTGVNAIVGNTLVLSVNASDASSGVAKVYARVDQNPVASPGVSGYVELGGSGGTWTLNDDLDTDGLLGGDAGRAEGSWYLHVKAEDAAGNRTPDGAAQTRAFDVDQASPTLDETLLGLAAQHYANAGFSLGGASADTNGIESISVTQSKDGGAPVLIDANGPALGGTAQNRTWTLSNLPRNPASIGTQALADGFYEYVISTTDLAGKTSVEVRRNVVFDDTDPALEISSILPMLPGGRVNGKVTLAANASDANGLEGLKYWLRSDASTPSWADGDGMALAAPYSASIDTTALVDETAYTLWVLARDKAGNERLVSTTLDVDQASDVPSGSIDSPASGDMIGADKKVRGTFSDDDGVALSGAVLYVRKLGAPSYTAKNIATASAAGQLVAWTVDVSDLVLSGGDGTYELYLAVSDDAARKSALPSSTFVSPSLGGLGVVPAPQTFRYDINPPAVSAIAALPLRQSYKPGDLISFSWTASDASGIAEQRADVDGSDADLGAVANPGGPASSVEYTVPAAGLSGNRTLTLVVDDATGKSTTRTLTFFVDVDKPAVDETYAVNPGFVGSTANGQFELKGSATDNRALVSVELALSSDGVTYGAWTAAALSSGNWTYSIADSAVYIPAAGTLRFKVRATDQAGNLSDERLFALAVNQAADKPIVTVLSPVDLSTYGTTVQISGTASDDDALAPGGGAIEIEYRGLAPVVAPTVVNPTVSGSGKSVNFNREVAGLGSGTWAVRARARDAAGLWGDWTGDYSFTVNAGAPNLTVSTVVDAYRSNATLALSGIVADGQGVKFVRVRINGGAWTTAAAGSGSWGVANVSDSWSISLNLGSDGLKTIEVQASDMGDFVSNQQISTTLDTTFPVASFDAQFRDDPTGSFLSTDRLNKSVRITGTVTELNLRDADPVEISINGAAFVPVTGTFVWNRVWDTSALADGDYLLALRITDKAGNVSTSVTKTVSTLQSADAPALTQAFVAAGDSSLAGNNILGALLRVSGTLSDDDGFNSGAVSILLDDTPPSLGATNTSGTTATWDYTWASLAQGEHNLRITATDRNGATVLVGPTYFIVDTTNPTLTLSSPAAGAKIRAGTLSMAGTASDSGGLGATPLSVTLRHSNPASSLHNDVFTPAVVAGAWSLDVPIDAAVLDGTLYIDLVLTDRAGKTTPVSQTVTIDTTAPYLNPTYPSPGAYLNGLVSFTGNADDANGLADVTMQLLSPTTKLPIANLNRSGSTLSSWEFPVNAFTYANATYGQDVNGDGKLWKVWYRLAASDNSGNQTEYRVGDPLDWPYFFIDTDGDKPTISVTQPKSGDKIGGFVSMFGTATDDDGPVMQVEVRIDWSGDGDFADSRDINDNDSDGNPLTGIQVGSNVDILGNTVKIGDATYKWEDESAWYVVPVSNNAWTLELNSDGELYAANTGGTGNIVIQTRSRDMFGLASEISSRTITLDQTFPRIENVTPLDQSYQNGTFHLLAEFGDNLDLNLGANSQIRININKTGYQTLAAGASSGTGWTSALTADLAEPQNGYDLDLTLNTATFFPGSSGILYVDLYVRDESNYTNQRSFTFYVDNQAPTANWSDRVGAPDGLNVRNGQIRINADPLLDYAFIEGNYLDAGAVSGIDRVEVYFVKAGQVRRVSGGAGSKAPLSSESTLVDSYNEGTGTWSSASESLPFAAHADAGFGDDYVIRVNRATEMSSLATGTDLDGDGYFEFMGIDGGAPRWRALFDSANLPDGLIDIHYVVYDLAGNRVHKVRRGFIANNGPVYSRIRIGSDYNGNGAVADVAGAVQEIADYYYPAGSVDRLASSSPAKIKYGKLYFNVQSDDPNGTNKGIASTTISIVAPSPGTRGILTSFGGAAGGNVETVPGTPIAITIGSAQFPSAGDYTLEVLVKDLDNIPSRRNLVITVVDTTDSTNPTVTPAALTQAGGIPASVVPKEGHLELQADNSPAVWSVISAAYGSDNDPKVSGKIRLTGTVYDNQRLASIDVSGEGLGTNSVLASWDGAKLVSADAAFIIDSQNLDENGHTVNYTYVWDSSMVTGVAGLNRTVAFRAVDAAARNSAAHATLRYDVVPFIGDIGRTEPLPANRSRYGNHILMAGETGIVVSGFNLGSAAYAPVLTVNRSSDGGIQNTLAVSGSGAPTYTALSVTGTQLQNSGWLKVTVNGQASINNLNSNSLAYNKEIDASQAAETQYWSDDRYVLVFDIGDYFAGSDAPEWPSMSMNPANGHLYGAWASYNTAAAYYAGPLSVGALGAWETATEIFQNYDPPEYTDILVYNNAGADVKHSVVLENENGAGAWRGLMTKIDNGSARMIEYLGGDAGTDTNTTTISHQDGKDEMLLQFKNARVAVSPVDPGTADDVKYISYYDAWSKSLKYAVVTGGTGILIPAFAHQTDNQTVVDGYDWLNQAPNYKYASSEDVGLYSDIGIDPDDGVPVIAYYSVTQKTLKIARGRSAQPVGNFNAAAPYAPSATHGWNIANVRPANSYLGSYVSMAVAANGDLHLVSYQNATGDLVYIKAVDVDGTAAGVNYAFSAPVTIDSSGSVGAWCEIQLKDGTVPYVSYLSSSAIGTLEGLKLAWVKSGDGQAAADWEYAVLPVDDPVRDHRTGLALAPSAAVNAGSFVVGAYYTIRSVGTTNFVALGAASNTVGVSFIATGVGTGTGNATLNVGRWAASAAGRSADLAVGYAGAYFNIAYRKMEQ